MLLAAFLVTLSFTAAYSQKGVDTQTEKIKQDGNKVTTRSSDVSRSIDWGKGKTKVRDRLDNPYKFNARRDTLIDAIADVMRENKIVLDEASSRPADGILVTEPFVFARGAVISQGELSRYGVLESSDTAWTRAQYTLTIEVQSIDGVRSNVSVNAKVEGRAGNGLTSEWATIESSGLAEDEFLAKLVEVVTGASPDPVQDTPDH